MNLAILGAQWGDEGKGKIVDLVNPAGIEAEVRANVDARNRLVQDTTIDAFDEVTNG